MKSKTIFAWIVLISLNLIPLLLWLTGPTAQNMDNYSDITHGLGQLAALIGTSLFALTFILSCRFMFIEYAFGGLDKVYVVHRITGSTAFLMLLFHPILLVLKYIPSNLKLAATFITPGHAWSVNFGIIALLGLILLIVFTFYINLKYHVWKLSHKLMGLVFFFAVLHIVLIRDNGARDIIFEGYYIYATVVSIIGLFGFTYSLLFKGINNTKKYHIESLTAKNEVYDITMTPLNKPLKYKSGQFVFLKFKNKIVGKESHPFSICSKSNNPKIRVVIKNLGDFTSTLNKLNKGDEVSIEGPYGMFNSTNSNKDKVWLAGGIGITPFIGMSEDLLEVNTQNYKVDLYYTVRDENEFVSLNLFKDIAKKNKNFRVFPWVSSTMGRLNSEYIEKNSGNFKNKEFYLCGPEPFKDALKAGFLNGGASKNNIFMEEFKFK